MQRLKQSNSGAVLPLDAHEMLSASTTQTLPAKGWCHVRMRLAVNGEAERSVHLYDGPSHTSFHHEHVVVPQEVVAEMAAAVRAAFAEREALPEEEDDSQALYRTIHFRDADAPAKMLAVEYEDGQPVGPAAAFEAAWRMLSAQFPILGPGNRVIAGLDW
jgi:hypothetical protein